MTNRNLPKLKPGDLVAGRFRIIEPIGSGGFSVVYRAHQEELNRFIALKILKPKASNDEKIVERFRREALYASHLSHPNTITLYDYGHTKNNLCFIAMEYLKGMDLSGVVQLNEPMDLKRVWRVLVQCSRSLAEAHKLGLVHRDLKPENIFLVESDGDPSDETVKVLDFGVSKAVSGFGDASTLAPLTQEGTVFGTPLYMAPEQAMAEGISPAVDVYALGHIMFEMITGHSAYEGLTNAMDVMLKQINDPPLALPPPWDTTPFSGLITLCTQKNPEHRVQSASVLLEHLLSEPFARWADPRERRFNPTTNLPIPVDDAVVTNHFKIEDLDSVYPVELGVLNRAFENAVNGNSGLVLIHGVPGSGRSNLLRGFVDQRARFKPRSTVLHRTFESTLTVSGMEYELSLLTGEETQGRGINEVRRILEKLYGSKSDLEVDDPSTDSDSLSTMRDSLFSQIGNPFREHAERQPIVWALESLERLDTLTLAFLVRFLNDLRVNDVPILIVATVFSNDLQKRPGVSKYAESLLKATPLDRQIFLRNDVPSWSDTEENSKTADPAPPDVAFDDKRTGPIQAIADPESPFDVILGHLAQLGDEIPLKLWKLTSAEVLETRLIGAVDMTLEQAEKFGIISNVNDVIGFSQAGYAEMLRDSFETLGGSSKSHSKIANLLQNFYSQPNNEQVRRIANQWLLGGEPGKAIEQLKISGDQAFTSLDLDSAREFFIQARSIANQYPELYIQGRGKSAIYLRLGEVHWTLDEHGAAEDVLQDAVAHAQKDEQEILGQANQLLGALAYSHGKYGESLIYYEHARKGFHAASKTLGFTNATNEMGKCALADGQIKLAETLCREALAYLSTKKESFLYGRINRNLGMVLASSGRFSEAVDFLDVSIGIFEKSDRKEELIEILNETGNSAYAEGNCERAIGYFRRSITLATQGQQNHESRIGAARILAATREFQESEVILNTALTHATLVNDTTKMSEIHLLLGDLALATENVPDAIFNYQTNIALAEPIGLFDAVIRTHIRLAYTCYFSEDEAGAFESLGEAMLIAQRMGSLDAELQIRAHLIYIQLLLHGFRDRADTFVSLLSESIRQDLCSASTVAYIFKADSEAARGMWREALDFLQHARLSASSVKDYASFVQIERRVSLIRSHMGGSTAARSSRPPQLGCAIGGLIPPEVGSRRFTSFPKTQN